ncbi:MAG: DUF3566 domain-containing protein [Nitriliruptor sp.]|uniref:DUF3566 domain-containing protein n=1 Tax=Nitriliruptor sp. TaxID=2448056 RepID=UPI0034A03E17
MARRRLTVRRIDPWSVLKFGAVANVALLIIGLLVVGVIFFIVDRLGLVDQVCSIVLEVGFQACGINAGNLFRAIALLGLLGVVIQTAVLVFLSFLHNLIADLTGGLTLSVLDDTPAGATRNVHTGATGGVTTARSAPNPSSGRQGEDGNGSSGGSEKAGDRRPTHSDRERASTSRPPVPPLSRGDAAARQPKVDGCPEGQRPDDDGRSERSSRDDELFGRP